MKRILFLLLAGLSTCAYAQTWMPVGNGVHAQQNQITNTQTTYYNGSLYVAEIDGSSSNSVLQMYAWDGNSWSTLPSQTLSGWGYIYDIIGYQGSIYVIADGLIFRFDGTSWSPIGLPANTGWINRMAVINNKLMVTGDFNTHIAGDYIAAEYDGSSWNVLPDVGYTGTLYGGTEIVEFGGNIHVLTQTDSSTTITTNLFTFNGTSWDYAAHNFDNSSIQSIEFYAMVSDGQHLYGFAGTWGSGFYAIENDSIKLVNTLGGVVSISDYELFNGKVYLAGEFGAGSGTNRKSMALFDGQNITPLQNAPRGYLRSVTSDGNKIYAAGNFTQINGSTYNGVVSTLGDVAILSGQVFLDQNSDCQPSPGEQGLRSAIITVNPGNILVASDQWGNYSIGLTAGSYNIAGVNYTLAGHQNVVSSSCNATSVTLTNGQTTQNNIASELTTTDPDLLVNLTASWRARFGFDEFYQLDVINIGATNESNVSATVTLPAGLQIVSASPNYSSQSGSVYTWNISSLNSFEEWSADFRVTIDTSVVNMGDSLLFSSAVAAVSGEVNTANNNADLWQEVVGAYDPNDKQAEFSEVAPGTSRLEYQIRFQNTGNDLAYKVIIRDTLEAYLYPAQLEMVSASHDYELQIDENVLTWVFNNILLPDSTSDLQGSQGYIRFSIGVDATLAEGSVIDNDAEIYFDFQQPVHTNHALTTIVNNISVADGEVIPESFMIYPNPARDIIHIKNTSGNDQQMLLTNTTGQRLKLMEIGAGDEITLDLGDLPAAV